ncbi:HFL004Wp [Eremothecium sinecaudum]|uniref:tRNA-splicing endonuclease subunit Sen34 n=1 Tax=Eremothecium sinecaudum TaxID=45286 RepID=A0A0X8HUT3_9SACH|nr:HFL004Wp [Eremothecium sinecaudum]AMD21852.1 HFL004Wp [Eremothecium sinecaudum]
MSVQGGHCTSNKVLISLRGASLSPLVFEVDAVKRLRELGILGILTGSLPSATQQNLFLTVPLRLTCEEAVWLVLEGYGKFTQDDKLFQSAVKTINGDEFKQWQIEEERELNEQVEARITIYKNKLAKLGIEEEEDGDVKQNLIQQGVFLETKNSSRLLKNKVNAESIPDDFYVQRALLKKLLDAYTNVDDYLLFKALRNRGYFLSPGGRFGARFIAYPGDPLQFHSHMAIQPALEYYNQPLDLLNLVSGGRLGTGVKKLWVVGGVRYEEIDEELLQDKNKIKLLQLPNPPVSFFSIEWSGFG